jgi:hypothetical protein
MKNTISKITKFAGLAFVAASLLAMPAISRAADSTNAPAAGDTPKKPGSLPYHGKVTAVDSGAMTFTIGEVYAISSTTKITKAGQPAVFADITVGESVSGSYKKSADGKNMVSSVKIGVKKTTPPPDAKTPPAPPATK